MIHAIESPPIPLSSSPPPPLPPPPLLLPTFPPPPHLPPVPPPPPLPSSHDSCTHYPDKHFHFVTAQSLILLQGSGRVRPGVWGCALCLNKGLRFGSMRDHIARAAEEGYETLVLNPNAAGVLNAAERSEGGGGDQGVGSAAGNHVLACWERFVQPWVQGGGETSRSSLPSAFFLRKLCRGEQEVD